MKNLNSGGNKSGKTRNFEYQKGDRFGSDIPYLESVVLILVLIVMAVIWKLLNAN